MPNHIHGIINVVVMKKGIFFILFMILIVIAGSVYPAVPPENVKFKVAVVNSSESEEKTIPAKAYLPCSITPEDIIDVDGFEVNYDTEKNLYFIFQEVSLKPKESVTLEILLKNIWFIPDEELAVLNNQVNTILKILQKSPFYNQAKALGDSIILRLKKITERQDLSGISIKDGISNYEANVIVLSEVKKDIGVLEDLAIQEGGIPGAKLVGETEEDTESAPQIESVDLNGLQAKMVKFKIGISNPRDTKKTTSLKYYLPVEVLPEYLLDKGGLEVSYDYRKGAHYVYKDNVELAPYEKKDFVVSVKDVWEIPEGRIEVLRAHAEKLMNMLSGSEYEELAVSLVNKITDDISSIKALQGKTDISVNNHIGNYRLNSLRLKDVKKEIIKLERLVIQAGGSPGIAVSTKDIKRKEWKSAPAGGELADTKSEETLNGTTKWVEMIGKSIFRGKAPNNTTTWRIIYTIVVFLGILSVLTFATLLVQQRIALIDPLTGTSNRNSINEGIKRVFKVSLKTQKKFSLLLMDIDKFKEINDKYGHSVGDIVLKEFVILIRKAIRQNDLLGRMGGDEFLVVLLGADRDKAYAIAERITMLVSGYRVKLHDESLRVTASVGIATYPDDAATLQELLSKVDSAMYIVKNKGGNSVTSNV